MPQAVAIRAGGRALGLPGSWAAAEAGALRRLAALRSRQPGSPRQYLGKSDDLGSFSFRDLAERINARPRRVLDWDTVHERVLAKAPSSTTPVRGSFTETGRERPVSVCRH